MSRVWLYARLSRSTEASTSVERQLADARQLAERRWFGARTIEVTDDGVSGAVEPAKRPGFGQIIREWQHGDVVVFWKVDRLARSLVGFVDVMRLAQDAGVVLVSVRDAFDLSTPDGRMQANILATFAEYEREMVRTRVASMRRHLHKQGRWTGGRAPYGLKPAPHPSGIGRILVRDPEAAEVVREIVRRIRAGEAVTTIAADLQARGVPSPRMRTAVKPNPKPSAWSYSSITTILRSPSIVGHQIDPATRRLVRENGRPVQVWDPIVSEQELAEAVARLPETTGRRAPGGHHWTYQIAVCGHCGRNLKQTNNNGSYSPTTVTLRCHGPLHDRHPILTARADAVSEYLDEQVSYYLGGVYAPQREWVGGADRAADLARLRAFLEELEADRKAGLFTTEEGLARYRRQYRETLEEIAELERQEPVESGWRVTRSDRRFIEKWEAMSWAQRGDELRAWGIRCLVFRPAVKRARVPLSERARMDWGELADVALDMAGLADAERYGE